MSNMIIRLGPIGLLAIAIISIVLIWLYGLSIIIGLGIVLLVLLFAKPTQVFNHKKAPFWFLVFGLGLIIMSAAGFGFQITDGFQLVWVGI